MANNIDQWIPLLHYYNKEKANPFNADDPSSTYWELEYLWVTQVVTNKRVEEDYLEEFFYDFPGLCDNVTNKTPTSLKAFMYNRYYQFGGTKECFESWLMNYIEGANR